MRNKIKLEALLKGNSDSKVFPKKVINYLFLCFSFFLHANMNPANAKDDTKEQSAKKLDYENSLNAHSQVITSAEDGFGSTLSDQQIGIYNENFARGFSPKENGNLLLEGMFYRSPINISGMIESNSTHVGISAQGFPFSGPSGVVNNHLYTGNNRTEFMGVAGFNIGISNNYGIQALGKMPIKKSQLFLAAGLGIVEDDHPYNVDQHLKVLYLTSDWKPAPNLEIINYIGWIGQKNKNITTYYYSPSGSLPSISVRSDTIPAWAKPDINGITSGILVTYINGNWTLKAHGFYNLVNSNMNTNDQINIIDPRTANRIINIYGPYRQREPGGEIRISLANTWGEWKGLTIASLRGYRSSFHDTMGAGGEIKNYIPGTPITRPAPNIIWGKELFLTNIYRTISMGLSQSLYYQKKLETNFSISRTTTYFHERRFKSESAMSQSAWLPSASANWKWNDKFLTYASYTRGLWQSEIAPDYASNARKVLPPNMIEQWDAGLRWQPRNGINLIIGYFDISRPYNSLDKEYVYRQLGRYGTRGFEVSYSQWINTNIYVLAAAMLAPSRIRNLQGNIFETNARPSGVSDQIATIYTLYNIPKTGGLGIWSSIDFRSDKTVDYLGLRTQPARANISLGLRYDIQVKKSLLSLRLSTSNLTNSERWYATGNDFYTTGSPRTISFLGAISF